MKKIKSLLSILNMLSVVLISISITVFIDTIFGIFSFAFLGLLSYILIKFITLDSINSRVRLIFNLLLSIAISFYIGMFSKDYFNSQLSNKAYIYEKMAYVGFSFLLILPIFKILHIYIDLIISYKRNAKIYLTYLAGISLFFYMLFIQFPSDLFFSNPDEFIFSYQILLKSQIPLLLYVLFISYFIITIIPPFISDIAYRILVGITLAVYVQYLFFNKGLGLVDGGIYRWSEHSVTAFVSVFTWLIILSISIIIYIKLKNKAYKVDLIVYVILFTMMLSGLITNILKAPKEAFSNKTYGFSTDDEFVLSPNGNIIIFIIDETDNIYIDEIMKSDKDFFDEYNDFTLYDNTCSVYDMTASSMNQLFTGYCYGDEENHCDEYYQRIKNAGYMVNLYAYQRRGGFPDIYPYINNCREVYLNDKNCNIDYRRISNDFVTMSIYQALPNMLKNSSKVNSLTFNHIFMMEESSDSHFENEDFKEHMKFALAENPDKRLIEYHIRGAHFPCDDHVQTIEYCLDIGKDIIEQTKELGVYDNSCIIIMSDHGLHDQAEYYTWPTAGSPLFMIKEAGEHKQCMSVSHVPVYYKDFQSTLLVNMGLWEGESDKELFGPSIYDFSENEIRERTWYDSDGSGFRAYTYEGDYEELKRVVADDEYKYVSY